MLRMRSLSPLSSGVRFRPIADISLLTDYGCMKDQSELATDLLELLSPWSDGEPLNDRARLRLLCHQPHNGTHAYLHRLYPGLSSNDVADIEAIVGQTVPPRMREFYELANGARVFEQVSVSGLVRDFNRDPTRHAPISIDQDNHVFAALHPDWHRKGYFRIGGVSFMRQDELICGPDDCVVVVHAETGEPLREYPTIFACLESFVREMRQFWNEDGVFMGEWQALDQLLLGTSGSA